MGLAAAFGLQLCSLLERCYSFALFRLLMPTVMMFEPQTIPNKSGVVSLSLLVSDDLTRSASFFQL